MKTTQSRQTHIFATRSDLEPGIRAFESRSAVKYVRRALYNGPTFEQYFSLLDWEGLGRNRTGDHATGPCFLVLKRDVQVNVETVPQVSKGHRSIGSSPVWAVGEGGAISRVASLDNYLSELDQQNTSSKTDITPSSLGEVRYDVSQKLNPDSISFLPGGIFDDQRTLISGHIGTASASSISLSMYSTFTKVVTQGFEKVREYRIGPEAARLMGEGCRLVTIGINSPRKFDLVRGNRS
jgi:hypothetical protein